jgi:formate/nitrite transporter FocA (FNT family)
MKKKEAESERLEAKTVYEVIQREGEKEMRRPVNSLWWSGFAAGLAISSSVVAEGMLRTAIPDGGWRLPLESFGYCVGFLIVILGRLQLFTENTITPVLPIMADYSGRSLIVMLRLWAIVLTANFAGTFTAAAFAQFVGFATAEQLTAFHEISRHAILPGTPVQTLLLAIPAGFYVAALVWMLPSSKGFEIWVIIIMTYLIAIGGFAHVVVGSFEAFLLMLDGEVGFVHAFGGYLLPALAGNIIGGTALFSLLAYAQVREEID